MFLQKNLEDKILLLLKNLKPRQRRSIKLIEHLNPMLVNRLYEIKEMEFDEEKFETKKEFYKHIRNLEKTTLKELKSTEPMVIEKLKELEEKGLVRLIDTNGYYIWSLTDEQGKWEMNLMNLSGMSFDILNTKTYEEIEEIVKKELKKEEGIDFDDKYDYSEIIDKRFWNQGLFIEAQELWNPLDYYINTYDIVQSNSEKLIKVNLKEIEKGRESQTSTAMSILIGELLHKAYIDNLNKIEKKLEELKKEV